MGNVVSINLSKASLSEIAEHIRSLDQSNAINAWDIAESLVEAKGQCEEDGEAWDVWVQENVGYSRRHADSYVQVYNVIGSRGSDLAEKGCSFNTLKALSARELPKLERKRIIDKMVKKVRIDQNYCVEIQKEIKAALPAPKATVAQIAGDIDLPVFSIRLGKCVRDYLIGGTYLFALREDCNVEDIALIAKVYKQKYHPDKGGTAEEFDAICRVEEAFTASKTGGAK